MLLKASIFLMVLSLPCFSILPLPYPVDAPEEESAVFTEPVRDPKSIQGYSELFSGGKAREMELPMFGGQKGALGYEPNETFKVPKELKPRVDFWKKIYSEYNSYQAVIHDYDNPEIIYDVVDISKYAANESLSYRKKMKLVNKLLKERKAAIALGLKQLHEVHHEPEALSLELFSLFKKFEKIPDTDKFLNASKRVRAQIGQRDRIVRGFFYGGRYLNKMMEIFEERGLPKELTRLPLVESAFNLAARSKVGASGIWQFMRSTGKLYLHIDKTVDERNDPLTATGAAADLLKQNFEALGSWPLALTAYNHGREGMARAVRTLGTKDLSQIINNYKSSTFGFASSNFYSEFLAILEVEREYRQHFGKLMVDSQVNYAEMYLAEEMKFSHLASLCQVPEAVLWEYNPSLTDAVVVGRAKIPFGFKLKVPVTALEKCQSKRLSLRGRTHDRMWTRNTR